MTTTTHEPIAAPSEAEPAARIMDADVGPEALPARETRPPSPLLRYERWLHAIFLGGLAGVFFVNALVALLQPADFTELVEKSAMGRWLNIDPGSWLGPVVGVNDLVLGCAVLGAIRSRRTLPITLAWAGVWLLAVMLIKVTSLQAFPV